MFKQVPMSLQEFQKFISKECDFVSNKRYSSDDLRATGIDLVYIDTNGRNDRWKEYFIVYISDGFLCLPCRIEGVMPNEITHLGTGEYLDLETILQKLRKKGNPSLEDLELIEKINQIFEVDKLRRLVL